MQTKRKYNNFTKEELQNIIENSQTFKECCQRIGYSPISANNKYIREISQLYNIDISHLGNFKNLKGKIFNRLTVLEAVEPPEGIKNKGQNKYWKCICSCENHTIIICRGADLLNGHTQSCGCLKHEKPYKDLTGQIFGKLTVVRKDETDKDRIHWLCKCECGNPLLKSVSAQNLLTGHTTSCGCIRSQGELKIIQLLTKMNIEFVQQYSILGLCGASKPLRFDFYISDYNIIIEYQGQQHYFPNDYFGGENQFKEQIANDNKKKEYCKDNNIKLIEIPYWDYNKLNEDYILNLLNSQ